MFYMNKAIEEGWSRSWLEDQIAHNLYRNQGSAITNFDIALPAPQSKLAKEKLKAVKFEPEFAGKLNFYVTAADNLLRGDGDNESVGLIICKTAKKTIVEWSLKDINKPLGVSTYQLEEVVARTVEELEQQKEKARK